MAQPPVTPAMFAQHLEGLIDGELMDPQQQVQLPEPLRVAVLSLLEYLLEDVRVIPEPLWATTIRLSHALATRGELVSS